MEQILIQFMVGGIIVTGTTQIAKTLKNPELASVFWGLPLSIIPVLYFLNKKGSSQDITDLAKSNIPAILVLLCWVIAFWFFVTNPGSLMEAPLGVWPSVGYASLIWLGCAAIAYVLLREGHHKSIFIFS